MKFFKIQLLIVLLISISQFLLAQTKDEFIGIVMPTLSLNYPLSKKISQSIDLESRNFGYLNDELVLRPIHVEVLNFTELQITENKKAGFGIRYRVEADDQQENELRLHQQYEWKKNKDSFFEHRLRVEERLYASLTLFRFRYKTAITVEPNLFCDVLTFSNEFAVEFSRKVRTEYEDRLVIEASWDLSDETQFTLGTQYRFSDFTNTRVHNLFLTANISFDL